MEITNSRAWTTGGGIHVDYSTRLWGSLNLSDLSASHGGGALNTEHLELRGQLHARPEVVCNTQCRRLSCQELLRHGRRSAQGGEEA